MGLGLFGGGVGVTRFLAGQGANVLVTDLRSESDLRESLEALSGCPVRFCLGMHDEKDFCDADLIVANPAVPPDSPFLETARRNNVPVETEVSLFLQRCPGSVIGITGSNGKTTTTVLTGEMIKKSSGKAWVGGNVGGSLLERMDEIGADDWLVMELSSFQLEYLGALRWRPDIALLTNLSPNHLDRHGTMENYAAAKRNIIRFQGKRDIFIYLWEDPVGREWAQYAPGRSFPFSVERPLEEGAFVREGNVIIRMRGEEERLCAVSSVKIPGRFNLSNVLAASLAAHLAGTPPCAIAEVVAHFTGVEHRLEFVRTVKGVKYYNDSVSTTPESTIAALEALPGPLVLIAGGYDKGIPFDGLADAAKRRVGHVILLGEVAGMIEKLFSPGKKPKVWRSRSLADAVMRAGEAASPGDTVVLSPGCASYDMFRNYVERGRVFKALVRDLPES